MKSLLLLFGLVPEDTHCPLEVLVFTAVHPNADATLMHIRKWLRILINRSLVLGLLIDHLCTTGADFAVAQHADAELREHHCPLWSIPCRTTCGCARSAQVRDIAARRSCVFVCVFGGWVSCVEGLGG